MENKNHISMYNIVCRLQEDADAHLKNEKNKTGKIRKKIKLKRIKNVFVIMYLDVKDDAPKQRCCTSINAHKKQQHRTFYEEMSLMRPFLCVLRRPR